MKNKIVAETKDNLKQTIQLVNKTLYKTIEFQLLFKIFYIGIFVFLINFIIGIFFEIINLTIQETILNEAIQKIPLISFFNFKVIAILSLSIFAFIYIYLIEKTGVIIITSKYFQNEYIGFFKTLLLSIRKTPIFIFRRIWEMRLVFFIFIGLYSFWKILTIFTLPEWIMSFAATTLVLLGAFIFLSILFRYTFTAYITCLEPKEKPKDFNDNLPNKFLRKKTYILIIFYFTLVLSAIIWLIFFYLTTKILLHFSILNPDLISFALAFFVAFTIMSILIILSLLKTFKVSIMTTLYFQERKRQQKPFTIQQNVKQPLLSKNIKLALLSIFTIIILGGALITTTIKTKTDAIITDAQEYINQVKENGNLQDFSLEYLTPTNIIRESISNNQSALETIEAIIFTLLAYIIIQ